MNEINNACRIGQDREHWVDFLKGITIILVILGHSQVPDILVKVIYLFHMPLFFMISGYLDNTNMEKNLWGVIKRKAPRLLWPYFTYGVIVILWKTFIFIGEEGNFTTLLLKRIVAFLYGNYIWENNFDYIGTLWFLVGLFCVVCISYLLHQIKSEKARLVITGLVAIFGGALSKFLLQWDVRLPWCLDVALVAILFYELGLWWKQNRRGTGAKNILTGCVFLIIGFALGVCNLHYIHIQGHESTIIGMLPLNFGSILLFLSSASLISLGFMIVASCLGRRSKLIEYTGRQSLTVMIGHLYIMSVLQALDKRLALGMNGWICFLLTTVLSVFASFIVDKKLQFLNDFRHIKRNTNITHKGE